jgi:hypothetical protein
MIMSIWQLITCEVSTKSETVCDHAAFRARAPRARPRTAHAVTTCHSSRRHLRAARAQACPYSGAVSMQRTPLASARLITAAADG